MINKDMSFLRKEIDFIDQKILSLLEERFFLSKEIGLIKEKSQSPIYHYPRERDIYLHLSSTHKELTFEEIYPIYREIISLSRVKQKKSIIYFEGEKRKIKEALKSFWGSFYSLKKLTKETLQNQDLTDFFFVSAKDFSEVLFDSVIQEKMPLAPYLIHHSKEDEEDFIFFSKVEEPIQHSLETLSLYFSILDSSTPQKFPYSVKENPQKVVYLGKPSSIPTVVVKGAVKTYPVFYNETI